MPSAAATLAILLVSAAALPAQDTKQLADQVIDVLVAEHFDAASSLYGADEALTCQVLSLLTRSPRRYTELDGPFVRLPAALVAAHAEQDDALAGARALALAGMVTRGNVRARDAALVALADRPAERLDDTDLLALRTAETLGYRLPDLDWPQASAGDSPARTALLAATDTSSATAPATEDLPTWTSWARAARLHGLRPTLLPALTAPERDAPLVELLAALETIVVCHGLDQPAQPDRPEPAPLPGFVSAGRDLETALADAWDFMAAHQVDGTFGLEMGPMPDPEPGITALNLIAVLRMAELLDRPRPAWVDPGLDWLASLQRADGAILQHGLAVYTTSVAIEALLAGGRPEHREHVLAARDYLLLAQADEGEGYSSEDDPHYGGDERPDMSNLQMALEAVWRAGTPPDHPVYGKAVTFVMRTQNLAETNTEHWPRRGGGTIVPGTDGGGTYMPGNSPAGEDRIGSDTYAPRSYGSMTYALTKSYLLCGLDPGDHRVTAAVSWLAEHFTLDRNPGFDQPGAGGSGLYYYYLAMARTLSLLPEGGFRDRDGVPIPWRTQLRRHLIDHQRSDGSWINERSPRWWEGAPTLATAYAVITLYETTTDAP